MTEIAEADLQLRSAPFLSPLCPELPFKCLEAILMSVSLAATAVLNFVLNALPAGRFRPMSMMRLIILIEGFTEVVTTRMKPQHWSYTIKIGKCPSSDHFLSSLQMLFS